MCAIVPVTPYHLYCVYGQQVAPPVVMRIVGLSDCRMAHHLHLVIAAGGKSSSLVMGKVLDCRIAGCHVVCTVFLFCFAPFFIFTECHTSASTVPHTRMRTRTSGGAYPFVDRSHLLLPVNRHHLRHLVQSRSLIPLKYNFF